MLRHPLFLLLASSLLVSGVGRMYNDYAEHKRDWADRREKLAPLLIELHYRELLITRESKPFVEFADKFLDAANNDPHYAEEIAKAILPFDGQRADPKVEKDLARLEQNHEQLEKAIIPILRGEAATSDPQFKNVHISVLIYRIELLSRLPVQRFVREKSPIRGAPPWARDPPREVGILPALLALEQNLLPDPSELKRALTTLATYTVVRERNYADEIIPIEQQAPYPKAADYVKIADEESKRSEEWRAAAAHFERSVGEQE